MNNLPPLEPWFNHIHALMKELLGLDYAWHHKDEFSAHPIVFVGYSPDFNLGLIKEEMLRRLDHSYLQFVTFVGDDWNHRYYGLTPYFGVSPIIDCPERILYHVTQRETWEKIQEKGLLPSSLDRKFTNFPDTIGKIHGSKLLSKSKDELGDPAVRWIKEFKERKLGEDFVIIEVDLSDLPSTARVYRDTHSSWGIVVDRVESIKPDKLKEIILDSSFDPL